MKFGDMSIEEFKKSVDEFLSQITSESLMNTIEGYILEEETSYSPSKVDNVNVGDSFDIKNIKVMKRNMIKNISKYYHSGGEKNTIIVDDIKYKAKGMDNKFEGLDEYKEWVA